MDIYQVRQLQAENSLLREQNDELKTYCDDLERTLFQMQNKQAERDGFIMTGLENTLTKVLVLKQTLKCRDREIRELKRRLANVNNHNQVIGTFQEISSGDVLNRGHSIDCEIIGLTTLNGSNYPVKGFDYPTRLSEDNNWGYDDVFSDTDATSDYTICCDNSGSYQDIQILTNDGFDNVKSCEEENQGSYYGEVVWDGTLTKSKNNISYKEDITSSQSDITNKEDNAITLSQNDITNNEDSALTISQNDIIDVEDIKAEVLQESQQFKCSVNTDDTSIANNVEENNDINDYEIERNNDNFINDNIHICHDSDNKFITETEEINPGIQEKINCDENACLLSDKEKSVIKGVESSQMDQIINEEMIYEETCNEQIKESTNEDNVLSLDHDTPNTKINQHFSGIPIINKKHFEEMIDGITCNGKDQYAENSLISVSELSHLAKEHHESKDDGLGDSIVDCSDLSYDSSPTIVPPIALPIVNEDNYPHGVSPNMNRYSMEILPDDFKHLQNFGDINFDKSTENDSHHSFDDLISVQESLRSDFQCHPNLFTCTKDSEVQAMDDKEGTNGALDKPNHVGDHIVDDYEISSQSEMLLEGKVDENITKNEFKDDDLQDEVFDEDGNLSFEIDQFVESVISNAIEKENEIMVDTKKLAIAELDKDQLYTKRGQYSVSGVFENSDVSLQNVSEEINNTKEGQKILKCSADVSEYDFTKTESISDDYAAAPSDHNAKVSIFPCQVSNETLSRGTIDKASSTNLDKNLNILQGDKYSKHIGDESAFDGCDFDNSFGRHYESKDTVCGRDCVISSDDDIVTREDKNDSYKDDKDDLKPNPESEQKLNFEYNEYSEENINNSQNKYSQMYEKEKKLSDDENNIPDKIALDDTTDIAFVNHDNNVTNDDIKEVTDDVNDNILPLNLDDRETTKSFNSKSNLSDFYKSGSYQRHNSEDSMSDSDSSLLATVNDEIMEELIITED